MFSGESVPLAGRSLLVHHVAKRLRVPPRTIRHWALTGRIPAWKDGAKIWKFDEAKVESFRLERLAKSRQSEDQCSPVICRSESASGGLNAGSRR